MEMPSEGMPMESETPVESQPVNMEMPSESLLTETETPAESQPVHVEMPSEGMLAESQPNMEIPTESLPKEFETSSTKSALADDEIPRETQPDDSKTYENLSDINSSISHSRLPFPDVSKKFYFREGRRWARNEKRNKDHDVSSSKCVRFPAWKNIVHLRKELKNEKDRHKQAVKYRVINEAVKLKESIVLSTREAALLYTSEKNRILNIQDMQTSYRASDTQDQGHSFFPYGPT